MKNSLLQDKSYSTLIKLRKHFVDIYNVKVRSLFDDDDKKLFNIIQDIDDILLAKYTYDTTHFYDYSQSPTN